MMNAWIELKGTEENYIWDRFFTQFNFIPSVKKENWQGIMEPTPSVTYEISHVYKEDNEQFKIINFNLMESVLKCFQNLLSKEEYLYALDWQHKCYKFYPHLPFELEFDEWIVPLIPDGDYHIFLEKDLHFGIFGHPWEQTMCVFGEELIVNIEKLKPTLFTNIVRCK